MIGLRAQKKQETRQEISDQATRLFIERGFEATTIAEIADAARVAKKTVTNYFPRKEDLALDHHEAFTAGLAATVAGRAPGESALAALSAAFLDAARSHDPVIGFSGEPFARMIADSPTLTARLRELHELREEALAAVLAVETGAAPGDIGPRAAATLLGGAHRVLLREVMDLTLDGLGNDEIAERAMASASAVFDMLEAALGDYAVRAAA